MPHGTPYKKERSSLAYRRKAARQEGQESLRDVRAVDWDCASDSEDLADGGVGYGSVESEVFMEQE